jgi:hypothetical protein
MIVPRHISLRSLRGRAEFVIDGGKGDIYHVIKSADRDLDKGKLINASPKGPPRKTSALYKLAFGYSLLSRSHSNA